MENLNQNIENHYLKEGLLEDIINRLKDQNINLNVVKRSDIAGVDEFHIRGAEVSKELVAEFNLMDKKVLDVGCGLGGPCRMLADEFNCQVTGIDLSHEFISTAQKLSELVNLREKIEFIQGDALNLPFEDGSFNVVWTQHVQMNIKDKLKFYSEISRVLDKSGVFIYYDIFKRDNQDVKYPVPWANDKSISFLQTISNMDTILKDLGFTELQVSDQTAKGIDFFTNLLEKIRVTGPPKIGLNVLMGSSTKEKIGNVLTSLKDKKIELQSGIYKK